MSDQIEDQEEQEVDLTDEDQVDGEDALEDEGDGGEGDVGEDEHPPASDDTDGDEEEGGQERDDSVVIDIAQPDESEDSPVIRTMRKNSREMAKRIKELESQVAQQAPATKELGPKPTLADFDYDSEKHEEALLAWHRTKESIQADREAEKEKQQQQQRAWAKKVDAYQDAKAALGVSNIDELEEVVRERLPVEVQSVIVAHAKTPAHMVYALASKPELLEEMASSEDVVQAAYKLGQMEGRLKFSENKRTRPAPERSVKGTTQKPRSLEKQLEAAREKADKTGNLTEVMRIKKLMRQAG